MVRYGRTFFAWLVCGRSHKHTLTVHTPTFVYADPRPFKLQQTLLTLST